MAGPCLLVPQSSLSTLGFCAYHSGLQLPRPPTESAPAGGEVTLDIRSSLQLTPADVAALQEQLAGGRNHFVCLQLATMVREQVARNMAAAAAGDAEVLAEGELVFLATLAVGGRVCGGTLFYPRAPKAAGGAAAGETVAAAAAEELALAWTYSLTVRAGTAAEDGTELATGVLTPAVELPLAAAAKAAPAPTEGPHVYVELICVNAPGRGYGARLLAHVERFVAANAGALAARRPLLAPLAGVRLLSVGSAQGFYAARGYGEPDAAHEMFKPLAALAC